MHMHQGGADTHARTQTLHCNMTLEGGGALETHGDTEHCSIKLAASWDTWDTRDTMTWKGRTSFRRAPTGAPVVSGVCAASPHDRPGSRGPTVKYKRRLY